MAKFGDKSRKLLDEADQKFDKYKRETERKLKNMKQDKGNDY